MSAGGMDAGDLVEFFDKKGLTLALLVEVKNKRGRALTLEGREVAVAAGRVAHFTPARFFREGAPKEELLAKMARADRERAELANKVSVEELWELLKDEEEGFSPEELAELVFHGEPDPEKAAAVLRALVPDRFYFKYRAGLFHPLKPHQVASLMEQARREEEKKRALEKACRWLRDAQEEGARPEDYPEFVEMLKDYCIRGPEYEGRLFVEEALKAAGLPLDPFPLLVDAGVYSEDENLWLKKMGVPEEFPPGALGEAEEIKGAPVSASGTEREDLTGLDVFTIDGAATRDFDDAIHIRETDEGFEVGVHLADVASLISVEGPLDLAARERATSIYLPDVLIPMLPRDLSEEFFSLREGELKAALSVVARLGPRGDVSSFEILRSNIRVKRRLTYQQADELLDAGEGDIPLAHRLARLLKEKRRTAGARFLPLPDVNVIVQPWGEILIRRYDKETASQELVSELMILANHLVGRYLAENRVPSLFRSQEPFPEAQEDEAGEDSLFTRLMMLRRMPRAEISTAAKRHHGLGLDPYTGITSPIRKYFDLVVQRQLNAYLAGQRLPHDPEELGDVGLRIDLATRTANFVKKRWTRYWILKHLAPRKGEVFDALVTDRGRKTVRVVLTDFMLDLSLVPEIALSPGDNVRVRLTRVEPREDIIKAQLV